MCSQKLRSQLQTADWDLRKMAIASCSLEVDLISGSFPPSSADDLDSAWQFAANKLVYGGAQCCVLDVNDIIQYVIRMNNGRLVVYSGWA